MPILPTAAQISPTGFGSLLLALGVFAALILFWYYRRKPEASADTRTDGTPHAQRYDNRARKREAEIDRILEKVSQQGMDSLTDKERKLLQSRSQKEQKRRS